MCAKYAILVLLVYVKLIGLAESDCVLSLKNDLSSPQPVLLKGEDFLAPDAASGDITLKAGAIVTAACPASPHVTNFVLLSNTSAGTDVVRLVCVSQRTFRAEGWTGDFKDVKCNMGPWFSGELTNTRCYDGHPVARVGYTVHKTFHLLYEACFDNATYSTLYVKHHLDTHNLYIQKASRPNFVEGTLFGKIRMNTIYKLKKQKERFLEILGQGADEKYLTKADSLTRGHLAARGDFSLESGQRASFHLANVAPQWRRGNQGDWAALESAVRQRVSKYGARVAVYTGTFGVTTLRDASGTHTPLYLAADENGNGIAPVPMYFYKVVHDSSKRSATAFVSINNPYYNETEMEELLFCEDVCRENRDFRWLTWRANDGTTSFCCEFGDFNRTVKHLSSLRVDSLFY